MLCNTHSLLINTAGKVSLRGTQLTMFRYLKLRDESPKNYHNMTKAKGKTFTYNLIRLPYNTSYASCALCSTGIISANRFGSTDYDEKCSRIPFPSTASCARKPAAASMARRPFCSSFVIIRFNSSGSAGFKPRGSNPMSPG